MPTVVDQISKRYMVCLLCLHYKFSDFLPKMSRSALKIENLELFSHEITTKNCSYHLGRQKVIIGIYYLLHLYNRIYPDFIAIVPFQDLFNKKDAEQV